MNDVFVSLKLSFNSFDDKQLEYNNKKGRKTK